MKFFATFGVDSPLGRNYQVIEADDRAAAQRIMFAAYGPKWAFLYNYDDPQHGALAQEGKYGIKPLAKILEEKL